MRRVEVAAALLDEHLRVYIAADLRLRVIVRTKDLVALDALATLAGGGHATSAQNVWGSTKEEVLLKVMRECHPFMVERKELAAAVIEFLEATTSEGMLSGLLNILRSRGVRRGMHAVE